MNYLTLLLTLITINVFSQGFEWNENINMQLRANTLEVDASKTRSILPASSSLERYIPFVHHQGETAMCVAYSLANCRTIIYAKNKRLSNETDIIRNSFSPFHLYYHTKNDNDYLCNKGLNPADAINYLYNYGIAKLTDVEYPEYWPFTENQLCNYYPPNRQIDNQNASTFKIDEASVFKDGLSTWDQIKILKNAIASGKPIFFGMDPFPKSLASSFGKDFWKPDLYNPKNNNEIGHAMTIIGYDDNKYGGSFQILNSYGNDWGNNGKIWIKYYDLMEHSAMFVIIGKKYESSFGSKPKLSSNNNNEQLFGGNSEPNFIKNLKLTPPLQGFE
tara:strand:- start:341 stop:1336 length:996 start_codon:yes stop_codon:yes gene_type:complete